MAERPASPSDYLAAERTFLAWIRTGLALMGFGFVVARFGLFLQALQAGASRFQPRAYGPSFWFGTGLIVVGVAVNLIAARNHVHLVRQLNRGESGYTRPSSLAIAVAVILAVLGLAMAIYLISVRDPIEKSTSNSDNGAMSIRHALVKSNRGISRTPHRADARGTDSLRRGRSADTG
jgi:putative membrane protein